MRWTSFAKNGFLNRTLSDILSAMTQEKGSNFFSILQSDYAAWLSQILLSAFYEEISSRKNIIFPQSLRDVQNDNIRVPARVQDSQEILHELGGRILQSETLPPKESLETFLSAFENFQNALQRLEQDSLLADYGVDALTGMRSNTVMIAELERELERRARRGQPFCVVLSRIDGDDARLNPDNIILAARAIEKTIRSFDDAYVTGDGEFISSLKHSDDNGGLKFVVRLNEILKANRDVRFTMSSCVAEPLPGDDISQLIANVRKDLNEIAGQERGAAGQYEDVSPLSRYIKSLEDPKS